MERFRLRELHDLKKLFSSRSITRLASIMRTIMKGSKSSRGPEAPIEDMFKAFSTPETFLIVSRRMREVETQKAMAMHDVKRNELL